MFRKGFFTSTTWTINGDGFAIGNNAEGADFLAKILYTVLGDGAAAVTKTGFQTVKKTGLTCTVKPFFIAKSGYFAWDTADTDITFTSSTSEQVFYVGARLDLANNTYTGGIAARTTFVAATDLVSAKITIPANAVALTDGMIEDLRYNTTYCGQIDEYRERSLALIAELEVALDALISGGVPAHASTHAVGGTDPIAYVSYEAQSLSSAQKAQSSANIDAIPSSALSSNLIINGNFNINQDNRSGTVTLTAGSFGHDRWKAGASGCTYTFATSENITTLTISAGSLIQVVEGINLRSGTICLSWSGTAQGKIGAGSYSASGVTGTATGGTNLNIEFNTGTISLVQLNYGSFPLTFSHRSYADELRMCQRYYIPVAGSFCTGWVNGTTTLIVLQPTPVRMRADPTPTLVFNDNAIFNNIVRSISSVTSATLYGAAGVMLTFVLSSAAAGTYSAITVNTVVKLRAEL